MELHVFARFHARPGQEPAVEAAIREVAGPSRAEPACLELNYYRSKREPHLFYIVSRWTDEAAFEVHAGLPHTVRFLQRVQPLIDHALDITRAEKLA